MTGGMPTLTQVLFAMGVALVVAVSIRVYQARSAKQPPPHVHDVLMKRAEVFASESPFLAHLCRQYRTNGHLSDRQAKTVAKAIARLEAERPDAKRGG